MVLELQALDPPFYPGLEAREAFTSLMTEAGYSVLARPVFHVLSKSCFADGRKRKIRYRTDV